jgi:hypothetical protein
MHENPPTVEAVTTSPLAGTFEQSTATATVNQPPAYSWLTTRATETPV